MSDAAGPSTTPEVAQVQQGKKRKRTGKEREERKQAAIAAAQAQDAEDKIEDADVEKFLDIGTEAAGVEVTEEAEGAKEADAIVETKPEVDLEVLVKRLPTALKHLHPVFKRAKTAETARLIKKIKTLKTKGKGQEAELADMEAQRQLIAHHSVAPTISNQLLTNLRKHRLFKRNPDLLPKAVVDQLSSTSPSETTSESAQTLKKIENRLCSSKAAAEEVRKAVAWLVGEEGAKLGGPGKKASAPVATPSRGKTGASKPKPAAEAAEDDEDDEGDVSISRNMVVGSDDEEDGSDFDQDEVAADDAGWESGSVSGDDLAIPRTSVSASRARFADESGSEDDDAISIAPTPKKSKTKAQPKAKAEPTKKALTSSTFLPSLSTGFTRGGSDDSDPDDDTGFGLEDIIGKGRIGERKNRRGQRARQLIWERKYGKNAKHIKKAGEQEAEGNIANAYGKRAAIAAAPSGTETKPAAPSGTATRSSVREAPAHQSSFGRPAPSSRPPYSGPSARAAPTAAAAAASGTGPGATGLHPSWEAARMRKQKEMEGPKATKIVFD